MAVVLTNNAVSRLAASLSTSSTALSVTVGEGGKFPSPSVGTWFPLTLIKASGAVEILRCTARSGDVFTVVRAQESTSAQSFSVGDRAELRLTAAAIADIQQTISELANTALSKQDNLSDLDSAETARGNLGLGTAALGTVTTSVSDGTAGRVARIGDAGLGSEPAIGAFGANTALDIYKFSGFWDPSALTGTLIGNYPQVITIGGATRSMQIGGPVLDENRLFFRKFFGGEWKTAKELFHTGNVSAFIQTLLPAADAGAARGTLGAPAGVTKQMCTAWVNFRGSGTVTVRDSHNVSSVSDNGVGAYSVNFAAAMANTTYSFSGFARFDRTDGSLAVLKANNNSAKTTASFDVNAAWANEASSGVFDPEEVNIHVFGGK